MWVLEDKDIKATGFRMACPSMRTPIGLRTPETISDRVWLRLVTDLTAEHESHELQRAATELLGSLAGGQRLAIALSANRDEPHNFELYVELAADEVLDALFAAIVALANDGWTDEEDDGWRRTQTWARPPAASEVVFVHPAVFWAQVGTMPWNTPAPWQSPD